jgi:hypothetical protein
MSEHNPEKVLEIAKDVVRTIKNFKSVEQGIYLLIKRTPIGIGQFNYTNSAQGHMHQIIPNCEVCALGACFTSYITTNNNVTVGDLFKTTISNTDMYATSYEFIRSKLDTVFSKDQLDLIEYAFEQGHVDYYSRVSYDPIYQKAEAFGNRFQHARMRLMAIMKNIVSNDGWFKPELSGVRKRKPTPQ